MIEGLHEKKYEDIYRSPRKNKRINYSKIRIESFSLEEYVEKIRGVLRRYYDEVYRMTVLKTWLERRVFLESSQGGKYNIGFFFNIHLTAIARDLGSCNPGLAQNHLFYIIRSYFKEIFPEFESGDPFKDWESYRLPFSHVHIDYMVVVFQMSNRMTILKHAEEVKMKYLEFLDFVLNEVGCLNEEEGYNRYKYVMGGKGSRPVRDHVIDLERKHPWNKKN